MALLWPDLPAELRVPVAGYSVLLTAMAYRATRLGLTAGLGGALFLLSDTLIATGVAEWPQLPRPDFWIMATYLAAQHLLVRGVMGVAQRTAPRPWSPTDARHQRIGTGSAVSTADTVTTAPQGDDLGTRGGVGGQRIGRPAQPPAAPTGRGRRRRPRASTLASRARPYAVVVSWSRTVPAGIRRSVLHTPVAVIAANRTAATRA